MEVVLLLLCISNLMRYSSLLYVFTSEVNGMKNLKFVTS